MTLTLTFRNFSYCLFSIGKIHRHIADRIRILWHGPIPMRRTVMYPFFSVVSRFVSELSGQVTWTLLN